MSCNPDDTGEAHFEAVPWRAVASIEDEREPAHLGVCPGVLGGVIPPCFPRGDPLNLSYSAIAEIFDLADLLAQRLERAPQEARYVHLGDPRGGRRSGSA